MVRERGEAGVLEGRRKAVDITQRRTRAGFNRSHISRLPHNHHRSFHSIVRGSRPLSSVLHDDISVHANNEVVQYQLRSLAQSAQDPLSRRALGASTRERPPSYTRLVRSQPHGTGIHCSRGGRAAETILQATAGAIPIYMLHEPFWLKRRRDDTAATKPPTYTAQ